jgi:hypothetical protein
MEGVPNSALLSSSDSDSVVKPILLPPMLDVTIDREDGSLVTSDAEIEGTICDTRRVTAAESECSMGTMEAIFSTECEGSVGTTEGVSNPPALLPSADVEMFLPDDLTQVVECSATTAPRV